MALTLGSLFDGIGVFPLAASRHGIIPVWASEIAKIPIGITKRHFPDMLHLGDITELDGAKLPPVDIITFGSPCQDLSLIGPRKGLSGNKSGLFFHAIRIIREMKEATNGRYPQIAVWENVAGAFSSNQRLDFKYVLEAFSETDIPMPASGRWANAGMVRSSRAELCWRLMDARYWGNPPLVQRRKRIFLVADFRNRRASEILFKPRRVYSDTETGRNSRMQTSCIRRISASETERKVPVLRPFSERRMRHCAKLKNQKGFLSCFGKESDPFPTLTARKGNPFSFWYKGEEENGFIRWPTPLECERMMGLPEGWSELDETGKKNSDGARYAAIGNAIALPCVEYIMSGIKSTLEEKEAEKNQQYDQKTNNVDS